MGTGRPSYRTAAIIVAAGRGTRFGRQKHTVEIDGESLWERCRRVFSEAGIDQIVIVGDVPGGVPGGERRRDSVAAGLAVIGDVDLVLVHDAARPLVSVELVHRVLDRLAAGDVDGAVPCLAVTDTVKRVSGGLITGTVDRTSVVTVQTPQGFTAELLRRAHESDPSLDATDDAALVERIGGRVGVVEGDAENVKITYPGDLDRARSVAGGQGG